MNYELVKNLVWKDNWNVEAIGEDGECYVTIFSGSNAKSRAIEYMKWKSS